MLYLIIGEQIMKTKQFTQSKRMKSESTPKRNRWNEGSMFNKQISRLLSEGMKPLKVMKLAKSKRS